MKPMLVVIEGIDGSGKTTVSKMLVDKLLKLGVKSVYTSEPSSGLVGQICRSNLKGIKLDPIVEALLFTADRVDHVNREIIPSLESGFTVICDRYHQSTMVYQAVQFLISGKTPDRAFLKSFKSQIIEPDINFLLDCSVQTALHRKNGVKEKFETFQFLELARKEYQDIGNYDVIMDSEYALPESIVELMITYIMEKGELLPNPYDNDSKK